MNIWDLLSAFLRDFERTNNVRFTNEAWERVRELDNDIQARHRDEMNELRNYYETELKKLRSEGEPMMFKMGDKVLIRTNAREITFDDELAAIRDERIIGVVEDVFENGDLQVRFVDGSPHDAVHWFIPSQLEAAPI
jgi:hypothetical protein